MDLSREPRSGESVVPGAANGTGVRPPRWSPAAGQAFPKKKARVKAALVQLARDEEGRVLCRYCHEVCTPPRKTFCSDRCVHEHRVRTQGGYVRACLLERDCGLCAACGLHAHLLYCAAAALLAAPAPSRRSKGPTVEELRRALEQFHSAACLGGAKVSWRKNANGRPKVRAVLLGECVAAARRYVGQRGRPAGEEQPAPRSEATPPLTAGAAPSPPRPPQLSLLDSPGSSKGSPISLVDSPGSSKASPISLELAVFPEGAAGSPEESLGSQKGAPGSPEELLASQKGEPGSPEELLGSQKGSSGSPEELLGSQKGAAGSAEELRRRPSDGTPGSSGHGVNCSDGAEDAEWMRTFLRENGYTRAANTRGLVKAGMFWQADHIVAVAEGGGSCSLSNLRTLCTPCHLAATKGLLQRRKPGPGARKRGSEGVPMCAASAVEQSGGDAGDAVTAAATGVAACAAPLLPGPTAAADTSLPLPGPPAVEPALDRLDLLSSGSPARARGPAAKKFRGWPPARAAPERGAGPKPSKPARTTTGYLMFCSAGRPAAKLDLAAQLPEGGAPGPQAVTAELGRRWRALPPEERCEWNTKAQSAAFASVGPPGDGTTGPPGDGTTGPPGDGDLLSEQQCSVGTGVAECGSGKEGRGGKTSRAGATRSGIAKPKRKKGSRWNRRKVPREIRDMLLSGGA